MYKHNVLYAVMLVILIVLTSQCFAAYDPERFTNVSATRYALVTVIKGRADVEDGTKLILACRGMGFREVTVTNKRFKLKIYNGESGCPGIGFDVRMFTEDGHWFFVTIKDAPKWWHYSSPFLYFFGPFIDVVIR